MTCSGVRILSVAVLAVGVLGIPRDSLATTICLPQPPCEYTLNPAKAAFIGTVIGNAVRLSANGPLYEVVTDFMTAEVFGARVPSRVPLVTNVAFEPAEARRFFLPRGASYLVHVELKDGSWHPGHCSSPIPVAKATEALEALRAASNGAGDSILSGDVVLTNWWEGSIGPAPDIPVTATRRVDGKVSSDSYGTVADAEGHFVFRGLPFGQYAIMANVQPPLKATYQEAELIQLAGCQDGILLFLTTASLTGAVYGADGAPVHGVRIRVFDADQPELAVYGPDVLTDEDGAWSVDGVPDGRYFIRLDVFGGPSGKHPYLPQWYPGVSEVHQASMVDLGRDRPRRLDFTLPPPMPTGTITGVVVDVTGRPAAGASVSLIDAELPMELPAIVQTDQAGRFTMGALVGRRLVIRARYFRRGAGFVSDPQNVYLTDPADGSPVTVEVWLATAQAETPER